MIIPRLDDGMFLMVNQYRYLASRESIEFPCGSVKRGSDHESTARVELEEETGYAASSLALLGEFNPYNGVTDEMCRVYLAKDLRFIGARPDETEEFELLKRSASEIDDEIRSGTLWDGMSIVAWGIARTRGIV
jgi:ADP-ribose pyrophosphatase